MLTSFEFPVFTAYIVRKISNVSSFFPIESKNFGLSGSSNKITNTIEVNRLPQIMYNRHGVKFIPRRG